MKPISNWMKKLHTEKYIETIVWNNLYSPNDKAKRWLIDAHVIVQILDLVNDQRKNGETLAEPLEPFPSFPIKNKIY